MRVRHFYLALVFRLCLIIGFSALATWLCVVPKNYILVGLALVILFLLSMNIIKYFNRINQWIAFFLMGIENEDTSLKVPKNTGSKVIDEVFEGMNRLNELFKKTKMDIGMQEQYFKSIMNQSATGLFSVNEKGRVVNINPVAEKLSGLQHYHHINALKAMHTSLPDMILSGKLKEDTTAIFENTKGQKVLFKVSEIKTKDETIKLVAVSDITKELDTREIDAWIKLARTLSHEIMNNITPITTLSQVILGYFAQDSKAVDVSQLNQGVIDNTVKGLNVIEERSVGLMKFVDNYRQFTKLPEPEMHTVNLPVLLDKILLIASGYPYSKQVKIGKNYGTDCLVELDENMFSQVLVNLIKNAFEAMEEDSTCTAPTLELKLCTTDRLCLQLTNNGEPIPPEIREQIFVPFYTTKESGSGIGLSLSKQMMMKMGGDILLKEDVKGQTCFWIYV